MDKTPAAPLLPLTAPTRSYVGGSDGEKLVGFLAASVFSAVYVIAPCYLVAAVARLAQAPLAPSTWLLCLPLVGSMLLPPAVLPPFGMWLLRQYPLRQIPKYFDFEEYAEFTDAEFLRWHEEGKRAVACIHPHGVFPFVSVCGAVSTVCRPDGLRDGLMGVRRGFRDPPAAAPQGHHRHLRHRRRRGQGAQRAAETAQGSCVIYVGMVELFHSTPKRDRLLKKRKGFVKIALRTGADLIPIYSFGNTTVLEAFKSGPLASLSRVGVSVTVLGRWFLPIPKRVKLRGESETAGDGGDAPSGDAPSRRPMGGRRGRPAAARRRRRAQLSSADGRERRHDAEAPGVPKTVSGDDSSPCSGDSSLAASPGGEEGREVSARSAARYLRMTLRRSAGSANFADPVGSSG
ncbi:2-acylglycerol O-acyltransferase [Aureococcus anophagefferens]|nr:2-acylglycerol O-acyltransferase [Aureococcus anophagefferens]